MKDAILKKLLNDEIAFVEEISRLCLQPETLKILVDREMNGWLYMPGESGSADWNLARAIGEINRAALLIDTLPPDELQLLVGETGLKCFEGWQTQGSIHWFAAPVNEKAAVPACPPGFDARIRQVRRQCREFQAFFPEVYLFADRQMVGFIKTIRETHNCFEVYIEVLPAYRGRGLGRFLLLKMLEESGKISRRLTYAVANDNHASLALAKRAGLQKFNELFRITRKS